VNKILGKKFTDPTHKIVRKQRVGEWPMLRLRCSDKRGFTETRDVIREERG